MTESKMQYLEGLLKFIKEEGGQEIIDLSHSFRNGTLRVLVASDNVFPKGEIYYSKVVDDGTSLVWKKSVFVNGIEYFHYITDEQFRKEVA